MILGAIQWQTVVVIYILSNSAVSVKYTWVNSSKLPKDILGKKIEEPSM